MILISAATGQYGRLVVEALLQKVAPKMSPSRCAIRKKLATGAHVV